MQATVQKVQSVKRDALRAPFKAARSGRALTVKVEAKGQKPRATQMRQMQPGVPMGNGAQMVKKEQPTPEVDPQNEQIVVFFKVARWVVVKNAPPQESDWMPLSVIAGNNAMNFLAQAMRTEFGRKLYGKFMIQQLAMSLYKDRESIEANIKKNMAPFQGVASKDFRYAFKIRDRSNPEACWKADDITEFPPEEEFKKPTGPEAVSKFFSDLFASSPATPATPAQ